VHRFQVKGTDSLDDCAEFGIALVEQHLVQAFAGYAGIARDLRHTARWARGTDASDPFTGRGYLMKSHAFYRGVHPDNYPGVIYSKMGNVSLLEWRF
jgi:hypothetical protein